VSDRLRQGGRGGLPDGTRLTWSVAAGDRGRRWRAVTDLDGREVLATLLELDPAGRPARLELTVPGALLTLHPTADGGLHGNVVRDDGIDHLAFEWGPHHELVVAGMPLVVAAAAHRLAGTVAVGEAAERPAVVVDEALRPTPAAIRFERVDGLRWLVANVDPQEPAHEVTFAIDPDGLPAGLADAETWPLEP
jgi:hypothetical protein